MDTDREKPPGIALLQMGGAPDLGPGPRSGVLELADLSAKVDEALANQSLGAEAQALIRSLIYLWHDHLEASHELSQGVPSSDGSYVHGIMHRREPDYGNAGYWFRRVGSHPAYGELASRVVSLEEAQHNKDALARLVSGGKWDPFAFIDFCALAAERAHDDLDHQLARRIQAEEFHLLLARFSRL